jgi:hypothetical protein
MESRLSLGPSLRHGMDGYLPMQIRPWKILYKKTYKHFGSVALALTFSLYSLLAGLALFVAGVDPSNLRTFLECIARVIYGIVWKGNIILIVDH